MENLKIPTLDYATVHLYPDSWGYNETWGATWIEEHGEAAANAGKTVVLEEYGAPWVDNRTEILRPWQQAVVSSGVAVDQMWQFSTQLPSGSNLFDNYAIPYNTTKGSQYQELVVGQTRRMQKAPLVN